MNIVAKNTVALALTLGLAAPACLASGSPADGPRTNATAAKAPVEFRDLTVVQWNVENLFDTADDPGNPGDDPFTPRGWEHWTDSHYQAKLEHLAWVLDRLRGDIVCLEEVENRRVLEDLVAVLRRNYHRSYEHITHRDGTDHRGIDVAMISALKPTAVRWLTPVHEQRDILVADFQAGGKPVTVMVNHWKSRLGPKAEATAIRAKEAKAVRIEVDRMLAANAAAAIMLVGDFNDDFDGRAMTEWFGSATNLQDVLTDPLGKLFYSLHAGLPPDARGTIFYKKNRSWDSFDSISVSRSMVAPATQSNSGWRVQSGSYEVVRLSETADENGVPKPFRRLNKGETAWGGYMEGYSDHFPVRVAITLNGN